MFIVYVLQSAQSKSLYVGFTEDISKRLATHNRGEVFSTKSLCPWQLIFHECYTNKTDALRREKYFKTTAGKRALKIMLKLTLAVDEEFAKKRL
jgi:putative endonuclease